MSSHADLFPRKQEIRWAWGRKISLNVCRVSWIKKLQILAWHPPASLLEKRMGGELSLRKTWGPHVDNNRATSWWLEHVVTHSERPRFLGENKWYSWLLLTFLWLNVVAIALWTCTVDVNISFPLTILVLDEGVIVNCQLTACVDKYIPRK